MIKNKNKVHRNDVDIFEQQTFERIIIFNRSVPVDIRSEILKCKLIPKINIKEWIF